MTVLLAVILGGGMVKGADPVTSYDAWLNVTTNDPADKEQNTVAGPGWFWNLGPTGIRALMVDTAGKCELGGIANRFLVKYVFPGSPAAGKVQPGDFVIGANGKDFTTTYALGYWKGFGYDGPGMDLGKAIEDSETTANGLLNLIILRNGSRMTVPVQVASKGTFSATFPYNCPKSQQLVMDATSYLVNAQNQNGREDWGREDADVQSCLALLAQGSQHHAKVEAYILKKVANIRSDSWNWGVAFNAMLVSEYYRITRKDSVLPSMQKLNNLLKDNQYPNFTYGHAPFIPGGSGYGPMCGMTTLCCLGWSMMERVGIPIHKDRLEGSFVAVDMRYDGEGYPYGWPGNGPENWKTKPVLDESYVLSTLTQIGEDIKTGNGRRGGAMPMGAALIMHDLRPFKAYSSQIVEENLIGLTRAKGAIVNGHGSGYLHAWFGLLGAARKGGGVGANDPFRLIMDYYKAYINLARCHDGSFYVQPTRDDTNSDYIKNHTRNIATAVWAQVLSVPKKTLILQGAPLPDNATPTLTNIPNQQLAVSAVSPALSFSPADAETPASMLAVSVHTSNPSLIPLTNIVLGGNGANRTVSVTPASGKTGNVIVTLSAVDSMGAIGTESFLIAVGESLPTNGVPVITTIPNQQVQVNTATTALPFNVYDVETPANQLAVSVASSETALIPQDGIVVSGSGSNRSVTVTPAAGKTGSATITLKATDAEGAVGSQSFLVAVGVSQTGKEDKKSDGTCGSGNLFAALVGMFMLTFLRQAYRGART